MRISCLIRRVMLSGTLVFAAVPMVPVSAATVQPFTKTLVATVQAPWAADAIPSQENLLAFHCGSRSYVVWQRQVAKGYPGQIESLLSVFRADGKAIGKAWRGYATDTEMSRVRFTGTCAGDRAILLNHWQDAAHASAGDMATTVTGDEKNPPSWQPDAKTASRWYKLDSMPLSDATLAWTNNAFGVAGNATSFAGIVMKKGETVTGSSKNEVFDAAGNVVTQHAPWYKDLGKEKLASDTVFVAMFYRLPTAWRVAEMRVPTGTSTDKYFDAALNGAVTAPVFYTRLDTTGEWKEDASPALALCDATLATRHPALRVDATGLTYQSLGTCDANGSVALGGNVLRIHGTPAVAEGAPPVIYTADAVRGTGPETLVYVVRTADAKLQLWKAIVK